MYQDRSEERFNRRRFLAASAAAAGLHGFRSLVAADETTKIAPHARHDPTLPAAGLRRAPRKGRSSVYVTRDDLLGLSFACRRSHAA